MKSTLLCWAVLALLVGMQVNASDGNEFYWSDLTTNEIRRAPLDGSQHVFVVGSPSAVGLAVDNAREKVYWTDGGPDKIQRANLNGIQWNPRQSPRLKNEGRASFLPRDVDFASAKLIVHEGRDTTVLEKTDAGLIVHFCDSPNGRTNYDLTITFDTKKSSPKAKVPANVR